MPVKTRKDLFYPTPENQSLKALYNNKWDKRGEKLTINSISETNVQV